MEKPRRPSGVIPGARQEITPARRRANSIRALKHGRMSKTGVSMVDKREQELEKRIPGAARVIRGFARAVIDGDLEDVQKITALSLAESELLRRDCVDAVVHDGVVVESAIFGVNDKGATVVIGHRKEEHPVLRHVHKFDETLGHTAEAQLITRKSRGEAASDAVAAAILARDAELRGFDKSKMLPPPKK